MAPQVISSLHTSISGSCASRLSKTGDISRHLIAANRTRIGTTFATGSPILTWRSASLRQPTNKARSAVPIRCEQSTKGGNDLDVWLGRLAMVGFAVGISVEIVTGKGLLENFGLITPLPTAALAVTGVVGILTAVFIFQSASEN